MVSFGRGTVGGPSCVAARPWTTARTGMPSPILFQPVIDISFMLARIQTQLGASFVEMEYVLQVSVTSPFLFLLVRNLTDLFCCSAVAIVSSGLPRPAVLVARCDGSRRVLCPMVP